MKRKFLTLASVMAILSLAVSGVVSAQTGSLSQAEVSVSGDTTITISVDGIFASHSCTGIVASDPNDDCDLAADATSRIRVTDYTGTTSSGHEVNLKFDSSVWTYDDTDALYGDVTVSSTTSSTNVLKYDFLHNNANDVRSYVTKTGATCTPDSSTTAMILKSVTIGTTDDEIIENTNTCPAEYIYSHRQFTGTAGTNGLGEGSYTNSATYTLSDGYTS
ncbi:hypothetical protein GF354_04335 [Candidatus Peregrinibacteria bacterium]|nr:hypothetical protein [Candidatus Peregrinibacteria bacterium]